MLLKKDDSLLLLVDVQEKLTPLIEGSSHLVNVCKKTLELAAYLKIPLIISEQYPQGLGTTLPILSSACAASLVLDKVSFSCFREISIKEAIINERKSQLVLIGIETHVCILQTAMDLLKAGFQVFIVVEAVGARSSEDHDVALKRLKHAGAVLITFEMLFFEWLETASHPQFKTLSHTFLSRK